MTTMGGRTYLRKAVVPYHSQAVADGDRLEIVRLRERVAKLEAIVSRLSLLEATRKSAGEPAARCLKCDLSPKRCICGRK